MSLGAPGRCHNRVTFIGEQTDSDRADTTRSPRDGCGHGVAGVLTLRPAAVLGDGHGGTRDRRARASAVVAVGSYALTRWVFSLGGVRSSGVLGGVQTQPALLAFASGGDAMSATSSARMVRSPEVIISTSAPSRRSCAST